MDITPLKDILPNNVYAQLPDTNAEFGIDDELKLAHFLGQTAYESNHFNAVRENLKYSAAALLRVFPKYFDNDSSTEYAYQEDKIANRAYANRLGNGDEASGDGYNYRGRGYIQLTGKDNYQRFGNSIGQDTVTNPDLVATSYPLLSAAYFFRSNNIFAVCEQGATVDTVTAVTKLINTAKIGLADRVKSFNKYYILLTSPAGNTAAFVNNFHEARIEELETENDQLRRALTTQIVKGTWRKKSV